MSLSWRNDDRSWSHRALLGRQCIKIGLLSSTSVFLGVENSTNSTRFPLIHSAPPLTLEPAVYAKSTLLLHPILCSFPQGLAHLEAPLTMLLTDSSHINTVPFYSTKRCRRWFQDAIPGSSRYLRHDALGCWTGWCGATMGTSR